MFCADDGDEKHDRTNTMSNEMKQMNIEFPRDESDSPPQTRGASTNFDFIVGMRDERASRDSMELLHPRAERHESYALGIVKGGSRKELLSGNVATSSQAGSLYGESAHGDRGMDSMP